MNKLFYFFVITSFFSFSQDDLGDKIQNPVADLVSLPFQNNVDFGDNDFTNILNIQPVLPFSLGSKVSLITRTIIPIISAPGIDGRVNGVGGITFSAFFTPAKPKKLIWAVGPAVQLPTITAGMGSEKTSLAPSLLLLYQNNGWTIGSIIQNFYSIAGPESAADVNFFYSQVFIVKNLKNGWYVNSAPIITANLESNSNKWTVPIGAGFGKLFRVGKLPINFQVGYYHYVEHPTDAIGQVRAQVVLILPKFYGKK